ncbi:hypothetical protein Pla123a_25680 [Posidoniimonas polymericola]|uniref:Uncharacterized protein n=1 Tax=Posidoniimonas polymericola TaxID=2528002 RepID=A0A5C5YQW7_9BACT|nr:hypothetical protein Pla123a_25680 [Posidoniimonas polymericola]
MQSLASFIRGVMWRRKQISSVPETVPQHLRDLFTIMVAQDIEPPPSPWSLVFQSCIGGLTEIGFTEDSRHLLVVSSQGRGVFDANSGERIARDISDDGYRYDTGTLVAEGFGPIGSADVSISGLHGGGLPTTTSDGWWLSDFVLQWPEHTLMLTEGRSSPYSLGTRRWKIGVERELRAAGFSPNGLSLAIATSGDLFLWSRERVN